jgi:hypothetical protein
MDDDERQRLLDEMKSSICAARNLQLEEFKAGEPVRPPSPNGSRGLPM